MEGRHHQKFVPSRVRSRAPERDGATRNKPVIKRKPLEFLPAVARAFVKDMRASSVGRAFIIS
jgi:hypothetical protein